MCMADLCRKHGISDATFSKRRPKYTLRPLPPLLPPTSSLKFFGPRAKVRSTAFATESAPGSNALHSHIIPESSVIVVDTGEWVNGKSLAGRLKNHRQESFMAKSGDPLTR